MSDFRPVYELVIDDYIGARRGSFFKTLQQKSAEMQEHYGDNMMKKYAYIYKALEEAYIAKSKLVTLGSKAQEYLARAQFCALAHFVLRNSNSSSILERSFSSACRSIQGNRYQTRNVFKIS